MSLATSQVVCTYYSMYKTVCQQCVEITMRGSHFTVTSCGRFLSMPDLVTNLAYIRIIACGGEESTYCVDSVTSTVSSNLEYN